MNNDRWNPENYNWVRSATPYVWYCENTGMYHFNTEDEQIDSHAYASENDAYRACNDYARTL